MNKIVTKFKLPLNQGKKNKIPSKKYILNILDRKAKKIKSLEIDPDWTISLLDEKLRVALKYDLCDHCSSFDFREGVLRVEALITPDGDGENASLKFSKLELKDKEYFKYVYDLGNCYEHIIQLIILKK